MKATLESEEIRITVEGLADEAPLEELPDLCALPWIYEEGSDPEEIPEGYVDAGKVIDHPWRTIWALGKGSLDDRIPLADLDTDVFAEVGVLMAAAPALRDAAKAAEELISGSVRMHSRGCASARSMSPCDCWIAQIEGVLGKLRTALQAAKALSCEDCGALITEEMQEKDLHEGGLVYSDSGRAWCFQCSPGVKTCENCANVHDSGGDCA